jgi:uncharacterized protein (TIGR03437 family)
MGPVRLCFGLAILAGILAAQTGVVTTVAGRVGVRGFDGDGGPATAASIALANLQNLCDPVRFEQTSHVTVDVSGNIYFTDSQNQRIRRIDPAGIITTVAGTGDAPQTNNRCEPTDAMRPGFFNPSDVIVDRDGSLIVADQQNNRILKVTASGVVSTIVGNNGHGLYVPGAPATASPMDWPSALALDANGLVYFAELHGNRVAKIADGRLVTVAGTGFPGFVNDGRSATSATLNKPAGIAFDRSGNLLIADTGNHRIRRVDASGNITTIAGNGRAEFCGDDGPAASACLNTPMDVKADALGNIYIADTVNDRVRRIDPAGNITTVIKDLNRPCAIAVDANNDLYIVDWQNYVIRKVAFPAIASGGIVNAFSFSAPVAPGGIFSIVGGGFAPALLLAGVPLPLELGGVSVLINGAPVPLYAVSPGQINAQLPYGIAAGPATAVVATAGGRTASVPFTVAPVAVGAHGAVANQDGTVNSPQNPESRGNALVCYVTGLGTVSPPVPEGQPAPVSPAPLSYAAPVTATVGGVPASVFFQGLTPNFIGLGQVNLFIPANAPTGDAVPVVIEGSNPVMVSIR